MFFESRRCVAHVVLVASVLTMACQPAKSPESTAVPGSSPVFGNAIAAPSSRSRAIADLAQFEAPEYVPSSRAESESPGQFLFGTAMEYYRGGNYSEAVNGLRLTIERTGESPGAYFYLAVAYLQSAQLAEGTSSLRRLLELNDPAYEEEARYFLAKALLRAGDVPGAHAELERAAALKGTRSAEAERVIAALDKLPSEPAPG